ncbi:MAG: M1 family aminopeptidase [Clostridia bacterium]|nr:M1 family aminopeptidase [Clostridia bacterium]
MFRKLGLSIFVFLAVFIGFFTYLYLGFSNKNVQIHYDVAVRNPSNSEVDVKMVILSGNKPYMHFFLRDPNEGDVSRIRKIEVKRGNKTLPMWQTLSGLKDIKTVWIGFGNDPVEITYTIDGNCKKGNKMISYINPGFGYLRSMNILYTPITFKDAVSMIRRLNSSDKNAGMATLKFFIPSEWVVNSPWEEDQGDIPISGLRNAYFGFGRFTLNKGNPIETPYSLAVFNGFDKQEQSKFAEQVPVILNEIQKLVGIQPVNKAHTRAITILPNEPIYGGAAGANSLIVDNSTLTMTHEIFHWWNGETIDTTTDANWIKEGFTMYYEVKTLLKAGLMSDAEASREYRKFRSKLLRHSETKMFQLIDSSKRLSVGKGSEKDNDIVYYGGALVARYLDQELEKQNKSLDQAWKMMYDHGNPISTNDFLSILSELGGKELSEQSKSMVKGQKAIDY